MESGILPDPDPPVSGVPSDPDPTVASPNSGIVSTSLHPIGWDPSIKQKIFFSKSVLAYTKQYNTCSTRFSHCPYGFLANTFILIFFWVYLT